MNVLVLWVERRVSDHDVTVERDGQHGEHGDGDESVAHEREQDAQNGAVQPGAVVEERRRQGQVEAAQHQVGHAQVHDEHGRRITCLQSTYMFSIQFLHFHSTC